MSGVFLASLVVWIIFSTLWDNRQRRKDQILLEMKDTYSKSETLDLVTQTQRQTLVYSLGYGFLLGIAFLGTIRDL